MTGTCLHTGKELISIYFLFYFFYCFSIVYRSHPAVQEALQSEEDDLDEHHVSDELTNEKIDNIERKLQAIERHIIDSTMKYTGAHDRK